MPKNYLIPTVVILSLGLAAIAEARPFRIGLVPNGSANNCSTCHNRPNGGPRNDFGLDVMDLVSPNGREEFWDLDLALEDSDNDGFANGVELGDVDGDGVPERTVNISNPGQANAVPATAVGDCNLDTELNGDDLACVSDIGARDAVLEALNTLPGDLDGNGTVAFADFLVLSTNFGSATTSYTEGNIDLVGGVEFSDFLVLSSNFGQTAGASSVPEPSGHCLVLVGATLFASRNRRRRR